MVVAVGGSDPCGGGGLLGEYPDFWVWRCSSLSAPSPQIGGLVACLL